MQGSSKPRIWPEVWRSDISACWQNSSRMSRRPLRMDSLRSFARSALSECGLAVRRVLFVLFSPAIHGPDNVAERCPSLGGSVLDIQRVSQEDFTGEDTRFLRTAYARHECFWTEFCHRPLEMTKAVFTIDNLMKH